MITKDSSMCKERTYPSFIAKDVVFLFSNRLLSKFCLCALKHLAPSCLMHRDSAVISKTSAQYGLVSFISSILPNCFSSPVAGLPMHTQGAWECNGPCWAFWLSSKRLSNRHGNCAWGQQPWEKLHRGVSEPGAFPVFSRKVLIVSRTLSGLFLVGAFRKKGREREKGPIGKIPQKIGKIREKSGKSHKGTKRNQKGTKKRTSPDLETPRLKPPVSSP